MVDIFLLRLLEKIKGVRVLCVGDVMLDCYAYGEITRLSPEAPVPVLLLQKELSVLGGAGNVARNISALKGHVTLVSVTGRDLAARTIRQLFTTQCGDAPQCMLLEDEQRATPIKTRHVTGNQQVFRIDRETVDPIPAHEEEWVCEAVTAQLAGQGALVLSDYAKGVLTPAVCQRLISAAASRRLPVVVDPKGTDYGKYRGATCITPNRRELEQATGMAAGSDDEVTAAGHELIRRHGFGVVVATRGEKGMSIIPSQGAATHVPTEAIAVYDVTGAGDTVVATLALALAAGADLQQGAALANCTAGIVVGKRGTAVALPGEVRQRLRYDRGGGRHLGKIVEYPVLVEMLDVWRGQGQKIGFTNGCFDLLHVGHVSLLAKAREHCDRLIVGLNTDASVKRLKGEKRPVNLEHDRACVLAALESVDAVVLFADDTPLELIHMVHPDFLFKGADYTLDQVVGREVVEAHGGQVILIPLSEGHSTTATILRMAED